MVDPQSGQALPIVDTEEGFILVATLVVLLLLIILGISATTTTNIELQIAGNDKLNKKTFYDADAATEVGSRMTEENVACRPGGFTTVIPNVTVPTASFWDRDFSVAALSDADFSNNAKRAFFYSTASGGQTNVIVSGKTQFVTGSGLQMVAGYEGKGKGAAGGGAQIKYDIISQTNGLNNAKSEVQIEWLHVSGLEGNCRY